MADGQLPPSRVKRKESYPGLAKVALSPTSISLPLSPTDGDLSEVERSLSPSGEVASNSQTAKDATTSAPGPHGGVQQATSLPASGDGARRDDCSCEQSATRPSLHTSSLDRSLSPRRCASCLTGLGNGNNPFLDRSLGNVLRHEPISRQGSLSTATASATDENTTSPLIRIDSARTPARLELGERGSIGPRSPEDDESTSGADSAVTPVAQSPPPGDLGESVCTQSPVVQPEGEDQINLSLQKHSHPRQPSFDIWASPLAYPPSTDDGSESFFTAGPTDQSDFDSGSEPDDEIVVHIQSGQQSLLRDWGNSSCPAESASPDTTINEASTLESPLNTPVPGVTGSSSFRPATAASEPTPSGPLQPAPLSRFSAPAVLRQLRGFLRSDGVALKRDSVNEPGAEQQQPVSEHLSDEDRSAASATPVILADNTTPAPAGLSPPPKHILPTPPAASPPPTTPQGLSAPSHHEGPVTSTSSASTSPPTSSDFARRSVSSPGTQSSELRAQAQPFVPPHLHVQESNPPVAEGADNTGGALGFFISGQSLRPEADEFRPASGSRSFSAGYPNRPRPTDLSLAQPSWRAIPTLGSAFRDVQPPVPTQDKIALPPRERQPVAIKKPQSPDLASVSPRRLEASPRGELDNSEPEFVSKESDVEAAARDTHRLGTHTARRPSQNSHLPRSFPGLSQSSAPATGYAASESVSILPSKPVRIRSASTGHDQQPTADSQLHHLTHLTDAQTVPALCIPDSNASYSPIGALPTESPVADQPPALYLAPQAVKMERSVSIPVQINPSVKQFEELHPAVTRQTGVPPGINVELADEETETGDSKVRGWIFPASGGPSTTSSQPAFHATSPEAGYDGESAPVVTWPNWPPTASQLGLFPDSPQPFSTATSAEFPYRGTPPRVLTVVNDDPSRRASLSGRSEESGIAVAMSRDSLAKILSAISVMGERLQEMKVDRDVLAEESLRRAEATHQQSCASATALELIREYTNAPNELQNVMSILDAQTSLLQDIQCRMEEDTRSSTVVSEVGDATASQEMLETILSTQEAMMSRFSEYCEANQGIQELRAATDALLNAQADTRRTEAEVDSSHELLKLQEQLREETNKTNAAQREVVYLTARVEEMTKHAVNDQVEEMWRTIKEDQSATAAALVKLASSEEQARAELKEMSKLLAQQNTAHAEAMASLTRDRDTATRLAEERHKEILRLQEDALPSQRSLIDRMEELTRAVERGRDGTQHEHETAHREQVTTLEREVLSLRAELANVNTERSNLRVQLTEAEGQVKLEQEKALRTADTEANIKRTLDLQLKAEKARGTYLENRIDKANAEMTEMTSNLDLWRSSALEQRMRAEQAAATIAAMRQENYHWRQFALGADRHRLEQWLATRPFEGLEGLVENEGPGAVENEETGVPETPTQRGKAPLLSTPHGTPVTTGQSVVTPPNTDKTSASMNVSSPLSSMSIV